jgi:WD40 repeat protein
MDPRGRYLAASDCENHILVWAVPKCPDPDVVCSVLAPLPMANALTFVLGRMQPTPLRVFSASVLAPDLGFSGDGRYLVAGSIEGALYLWDTENWQQLPNLLGHAGPVWGLAASPDGRHLASAGSDGTIRIWDLHKRAEVHVLRGHTDAVWGVAFSPDGQRLASAGRDKTVRIWEVSVLADNKLQRTGELTGGESSGTRLRVKGDQR